MFLNDKNNGYNIFLYFLGNFYYVKIALIRKVFMKRIKLKLRSHQS